MRELTGVVGAVIVLGIFSSVVRTLVIPRPTPSRFTRVVEYVTYWPFQLVADRCASPEAKDRVLGPIAPLAILLTLVSWLTAFLFGYALLEIAVSDLRMPAALSEAGSSLFTLGFASGDRGPLTVVDFAAAATGPITVGLLVGYLPTLYGAYARRETEVTLLQSRAGDPPWGPEILARYAQVELLDSLPELFRNWERWAAEVSESHTTYPVLVRFRSPRASRNWLVALLAVLDAAALQLALNPSRPQAEARLGLRAGFVCLREIADSRGIPYDADPSPIAPLELTYAEFVAGIDHMRLQGFPMERTPQEAWPQFRGWRVNYESLAYGLAREIDAVPALWSGPRRTSAAPVAPRTPVDRKPAGVGNGK